MHARNRLTQAAIAVGRALNTLAYGVIEDEYPVSAGRGFDQPFRLWIIDASDLVFVVEVVDLTVLPNQGKPFSIKRNRLADRANIMNGQAVRLGHDIGPGLAGRRLKGKGSRPVQTGRQIVEIGRDERQRRDLFVLQSHVLLLFCWLVRLLETLLEWSQIQFVRPGRPVLPVKMPIGRGDRIDVQQSIGATFDPEL